MSRLLITRARDGEPRWMVWLSLADHDPLHDAFGFVIGTGPTRAAAIADAIDDLSTALAHLQTPDTLIEEREIAS